MYLHTSKLNLIDIFDLFYGHNDDLKEAFSNLIIALNFIAKIQSNIYHMFN